MVSRFYNNLMTKCILEVGMIPVKDRDVRRVHKRLARTSGTALVRQASEKPSAFKPSIDVDRIQELDMKGRIRGKKKERTHSGPCSVPTNMPAPDSPPPAPSKSSSSVLKPKTACTPSEDSHEAIVLKPEISLIPQKSDHRSAVEGINGGAPSRGTPPSRTCGVRQHRLVRVSRELVDCRSSVVPKWADRGKSCSLPACNCCKVLRK